MSQGNDRTIPATPRRREDARNKGLAPTGAVLGWPAMAAVVLIALPFWFRATASAAVAAIQDIQMTDGGRGEQVLLPIVFPTIIVVCLALGVMLLVRTFFDGAVWRLDRIVFRFERIDPRVGLQRIASSATGVRVVLSFVGFAVLATAAWLLAGPLLVVLAELPASLGRGVGQGGAVMSAAVGYLWGILTVAIAVTVMDWWLQRFRFERKIRMTPSELREELRSLKANPKVRWQRNK